MSNLILHCGGNRVDRDDVYNVDTPKATDTHFPIPHTLLLEEVERNIQESGLEIRDQAHALTADGNRYFGLIDVLRGGDEDYGLVVGLRNTHDRSYAAALTLGSHVFVCDNLAFSGEVLIGRRHTRNIARDIPRLIPRAFAALGAERVNMERRIEAYKSIEIPGYRESGWAAAVARNVHDLLVRAMVDERILPPSRLPAVLKEWREPRHVQFRPRTYWSLFNCFTEVTKGVSPQTLMNRTRELHGFFDREVGLSLPTRDEILSEGSEEDGALIGREAARVNYQS